ncbi:MAG: hypothetical protein AAFP16_06625 [Pseudomonadota bacterium]
MALLALLAGALGVAAMHSDDIGIETSDPDETPDAPEMSEEPDMGASFDFNADTGVVTLEKGADETGSLAVSHYYDDRDGGDALYPVSDEARFYLVPEGVDWSGSNWENQGDVPGMQDYGGSIYDYTLADFERYFGLELLGVVDALDVNSSPITAIISDDPVPGHDIAATTDGDELYTFLPEDAPETINGAPEQSVTTDTSGTAGTDWLSADADGITVEGLAVDDRLDADADNVTLFGGDGGDNVRLGSSTGVVADTGDGDDRVDGFLANNATVSGGIGAEAYGGAGDDFVAARGGATAFGGDGNDQVQVDPGSYADGGAGDDLIQVWNFHRDDDGPATVTGGEGADTIDVQQVRSPHTGEADDIYLRITDFDMAEDVLQVGAWSPESTVNGVEFVEAPDGSCTDVHVTYAHSTLNPGIVVIRLDGVTGMTADQIVVTD